MARTLNLGTFVISLIDAIENPTTHLIPIPNNGFTKKAYVVLPTILTNTYYLKDYLYNI